MPRFDPRQLNRAGIFSRSLLRQPTPRGLFGPNIQQGGVGLGPGRNTLIAGPNAAATKAMGSAINRFNPPGVPLPTSPRVMNTGGAKVSDIFKDARLGKLSPDQIPGQSAINTGRYPGISAPPIPMPGMPPTPMQGMTSLATAGARRLAGQPGAAAPGVPGAINMPSVTLQEPANRAPSDVGDGPQGFMGKIGGFFQRPGVGQSMMAAGAQMMKGSPQGTFATIGEGLEAGLGRYQDLKEDRRIEEDRALEAEERAEKARREQAARDAILGDETLTDADKNLLITMVDSGDLAGALDRRDRIVDVAGLTARMEGIEGLSDTDRSTVRSLARDDLGAANQFLEGRVENINFGLWRQGVFDDNAGLGPDADPVFSSTEREWLPLLPSEMASSFMMDRLADVEMRPALREGLKQKYFGYDPQATLTPDQEDMLDGLVDDLEVGTALLGAPTAQITSVEAADGVHVYRNGIEIDVLPPEVVTELPPGLIESLPALKDFNEDFYTNKVEYLASRTDLNKKLEAADDDTFRRLNVLGYDLLALMERGGTDLQVSEAQAEFLQTLNTIGFENLSLFVGPTSDFEAGLAQMIQGNLTLSRQRLQELASRQLRQRLNLWARHNDRVERAAARLPEGSFLREEAESHYIKLMPEDVPGFTLDEWQREMAARSGAGGGSRILFEGDYPVTGAQTRRSGEAASTGSYEQTGNVNDLLREIGEQPQHPLSGNDELLGRSRGQDDGSFNSYFGGGSTVPEEYDTRPIYQGTPQWQLPFPANEELRARPSYQFAPGPPGMPPGIVGPDIASGPVMPQFGQFSNRGLLNSRRGN